MQGGESSRTASALPVFSVAVDVRRVLQAVRPVVQRLAQEHAERFVLPHTISAAATSEKRYRKATAPLGPTGSNAISPTNVFNSEVKSVPDSLSRGYSLVPLFQERVLRGVLLKGANSADHRGT